jgi:hypothetical protein
MNTNNASQNRYLQTLTNPRRFISGVPDDDATASVLKATSGDQSFLSPKSGCGLLLYRPHNKSSYPVDVYFWHEFNSRFIYNSSISYNQLLGENYARGRFVSGCLDLKANTVSGLQFGVSGIINAVLYQTLPPLYSLTFNTIPAFARNYYGSVTGVGVVDGVQTLAFPETSHDYLPIDSESEYFVNSVLTSSIDSSMSVWNDAPIASGNTNQLFATPLVDAEYNHFGNYTGFINLKYEPFTPTGPGAITVTVDVTYTIIDENDVITPVNNVTVYVMHTYTGLEVSPEIDVTIIGTTPCPIEYITCAVTNGTTNTLTQVNSPALGRISKSRFEWPQARSTGFSGPGSILAWQGADQPQKLVSSFHGNFQLVPDSQLSKNVATDFFPSTNPLELQQAERAMSNYNTHQIPMISSLPDYRSWISSTKYDNTIDVRYLGQASGFTDLLSWLSKNTPELIENYAPIVGGMIAGPQGVMVGEAVSATTRALKGIPKMRAQDRAALIGDDLWTKLSEEAFSGVDDAEFEGERLKGILNYGRGLYGQLWKEMAVGRSVIGSTNTVFFPVTGQKTLGQITVTDSPVSYSDRVYSVTTSSGKRLIISSWHPMGPDAIAAIVLAYNVLYFTSPKLLLQDTYVLVYSQDSFDGGSIGLAAWTALCGWPMSYAVTGAIAWHNDKVHLFQADQIEEKLEICVGVGKKLIYAVDRNTVAREDVYTIFTQEMGIYHDNDREYPIPIGCVGELRGYSFTVPPLAVGSVMAQHQAKSKESAVAQREKAKVENFAEEIPDILMFETMPDEWRKYKSDLIKLQAWKLFSTHMGAPPGVGATAAQIRAYNKKTINLRKQITSWYDTRFAKDEKARKHQELIAKQEAMKAMRQKEPKNISQQQKKVKVGAPKVRTASFVPTVRAISADEARIMEMIKNHDEYKEGYNGKEEDEDEQDQSSEEYDIEGITEREQAITGQQVEDYFQGL